MSITQTTPAQSPTGIISDTNVTATSTGLPVTLTAHTSYRTLLRVITPATAGDVLDITGRARVTNDCGYVIGVGHHLWMYDVDNGLGASGPWTKIGPSNGDNVEPKRHHMPLHTEYVYRVPASWPAGHRMVVVYRAEAHSTAAQTGDVVDVDALGVLTVRRWAEVA